MHPSISSSSDLVAVRLWAGLDQCFGLKIRKK